MSDDMSSSQNRFEPKDHTAIPLSAKVVLGIWALISLAIIVIAALTPAVRAPWMHLSRGDFINTGLLLANQFLSGLTLLLVFLTWRLYKIATEATTLTERSQRASHAPLQIAPSAILLRASRSASAWAASTKTIGVMRTL